MSRVNEPQKPNCFSIGSAHTALCLGASHNMSPLNNRCICIKKSKRNNKHSSPTPGNLRKNVVIAVLDRCGNNWKNGKGGCGPLLHKEYAPTVATIFQPFIIIDGG